MRGCHERAYGTGSSRWYLSLTLPSLLLHHISISTFLLQKSPHLFTSIFYPSIYSFLLSLSLYPLPPLPLPLSLPFHISTLFLSLCLVLTFIPFYLCTLLLTPPLFLFTLIYPPLPLYPLHLHSSISLHPSTSLPLSLFLPLVTLLFCSLSLFILPSDRSLQPRNTLHRTVRRELCLEP